MSLWIARVVRSSVCQTVRVIFPKPPISRPKTTNFAVHLTFLLIENVRFDHQRLLSHNKNVQDFVIVIDRIFSLKAEALTMNSGPSNDFYIFGVF